MKQKKLLPTLLLAPLICFSLVGCGPDAPSSDPVPSDSNVAARDTFPRIDDSLSRHPEIITGAALDSIPRTPEQEWVSFWKSFTNAIAAKDKKAVAGLSAPDFFDGGGGGTVEEWLDAEVFRDEKVFTAFQQGLRKGARTFPSEGKDFKATGRNHSGDLFFQYKKGRWEFGGVVGD